MYTKAEAEAEARRLQAANPDMKFYVTWPTVMVPVKHRATTVPGSQPSFREFCLPTRDRPEWQANDGNWYDSPSKARQVNARLAIREICAEEGWQGVVTADDVAAFIMLNLSALAPWLDDLNG